MLRDLVAVGVVLHLLATGLQALPSAGAGLDRRAWQDPTVQAELAAWREGLASVGISTTPEGFEDGLYALATGVEGARDVVLAPFEPYLRYSGSWQSWKMFVAPHRHPARLVVTLGRGADAEVLYRRGEVAEVPLTALDHDRMRGVQFRMAWPGYRRHAPRLAEAIAARVRAHDPQVDRVVVFYERRPTPRPEQVRAGEIPSWTRSDRWVVTFDDEGHPRVREDR